jgi:hypothetical protein
MTQLTALVAELRKVVCALEISIEHEEDRAQAVRVRILAARHLRDRRDNLPLTISTLENHLSGAGRSPGDNGKILTMSGF